MRFSLKLNKIEAGAVIILNYEKAFDVRHYEPTSDLLFHLLMKKNQYKC